MKKFIGMKVVSAEPQECKIKIYKSNVGDPGYKIVYEDGHTSWSPKEAFEKSYRKIVDMSFGAAIVALKRGYRVARKGWNGNGIFLELQVPDEHSKMSFPYIYIDTTGLQTDNVDAPKSLVPWLASQTDMLCDDWHIVEN